MSGFISRLYQSISTTFSRTDAPAGPAQKSRSKSFRIRNVHKDSIQDLRDCLKKLLVADKKDLRQISIDLTSAYDHQHVGRKVCVVTFRNKNPSPSGSRDVYPSLFKGLKEDKDELRLDLRTGNEWMRQEDDTEEDVSKNRVTVDMGFRGLTPLYEPSDPEKVEANIIAVMGLTTNAYGVWCAEDSDEMWLRHFFGGSALENCRSLIFGYDGNLWVESLFQREDFIDELIKHITYLLSTSPRRPILFVGHCYGGLIIVDMLRKVYFNHRIPAQYQIYQLTRGIFLFSTPHLGMFVDHLLEINKNKHKIDIIQEINKKTVDEKAREKLRKKHLKLMKILEDGGIKVYSYGEAQLSNTIKLAEDGSGPQRSNRKEELVSPESSLLLLPPGMGEGHKVNKNHRNIVKFGGNDDEVFMMTLQHLKERLEYIQKRAQDAISVDATTFVNQEGCIFPAGRCASIGNLKAIHRAHELAKLNEMMKKNTNDLVIWGPRYTGKKYLLMQYLQETENWENLFWRICWIDTPAKERSWKFILEELQSSLSPEPDVAEPWKREPTDLLPGSYELQFLKQCQRTSDEISQRYGEKRVLLVYSNVSSVEGIRAQFQSQINVSRCSKKMFRCCYLTSDLKQVSRPNLKASYPEEVLPVFNLTLEESIGFLLPRTIEPSPEEPNIETSDQVAAKNLALACGNHPLLISNAKKLLCSNVGDQQTYSTLCKPNNMALIYNYRYDELEGSNTAEFAGRSWAALERQVSLPFSSPSPAALIASGMISTTKGYQNLPDIWAESLCELFQEFRPVSAPDVLQNALGPVGGLAAFLLLAFTKLDRSHICANMFQSSRRLQDNITIYKQALKARCCTKHEEKLLAIDVYGVGAEKRQEQFERALDALVLRNLLEYSEKAGSPCGKTVYRMPSVIAHWLNGLETITEELKNDLLAAAGYFLYESLMVEKMNDITDTYFAYPSQQAMDLSNGPLTRALFKNLQRPRAPATCLLHHFKQISTSIELPDNTKKPVFECGILSSENMVQIFLKISEVLDSHSLYNEAERVARAVHEWLKSAFRSQTAPSHLQGDDVVFEKLIVETKTALGGNAFEREDYVVAEEFFRSIRDDHGNTLSPKDMITIRASLYGSRVQRARDLSDSELAILLKELGELRNDCAEYDKENGCQYHPQTISILLNILSVYQMQDNFDTALEVAKECDEVRRKLPYEPDADNKECEIHKILINSSRGHIHLERAKRLEASTTGVKEARGQNFLSRIALKMGRSFQKRKKGGAGDRLAQAEVEATMQQAREGFQTAAKYFKMAADSCTDACGPSHAETLKIKSDWALAEYYIENFQAAIELNQSILLAGLERETFDGLNEYPPSNSLPNIVGKWSPYFWANVDLQLALAHWCDYHKSVDRQRLILAYKHIARSKSTCSGVMEATPYQYKSLEKGIEAAFTDIDKAIHADG